MFEPKKKRHDASELKSEVWRVPKVAKKVGVSVPTLWRMRRDGRFPQGVSIGGTRIVGWQASTVERWINDNFATEQGV